jgi:ubiquinone/menaquinone biosynthesis C-methylase UbiE
MSFDKNLNTDGWKDLAVKILSCPDCSGSLHANGEDAFQCKVCQRVIRVVDQVVLASEETNSSFFDAPCELLMLESQINDLISIGHLGPSKLIEGELKPNDQILDIGCGRSIYYSQPEGSSIVAIDPSFSSVRDNNAADIRVCAGAEKLPVQSNKIDIVVFFYALHHLLGDNKIENRENVKKALVESWRTLRPGGSIFIIETTLNTWSSKVQGLYWNLGRKLLKDRLDAFMYTKKQIVEFLKSSNFIPSKEEYCCFDTPDFKWIPVILRFPWLKMPGILIPTTFTLFHWVKKN